MTEKRQPTAARAEYFLLGHSACDDIRSKLPDGAHPSKASAGFIVDKSECLEAGIHLEIVDSTHTLTVLRDSYSAYDPRGCLVIGGYGGRYDLKWNANVYSGKKCSELEKCICRIRTTDNKTTSDFWQKTSTAGLTENSFFSGFIWYLSLLLFLAGIVLLGCTVSTCKERQRMRTRSLITGRAQRHRRRTELEGRHNRVNSVAGVSRAAQEAASTPIPRQSPYIVRTSGTGVLHHELAIATGIPVDIHADTSFSPEIPVVYAHAELGE